MIAGVAQFKSQLTARAATRPSSKMAKKMPTASTDVSTLPRRSDFAEGAGGDDEWCREIEKQSDNYGKSCRAKTTSDEHDMYFWGFSEYTLRRPKVQYRKTILSTNDSFRPLERRTTSPGVHNLKEHVK